MKYMDLLGFTCRDLVTGFEGVAESVSYDLYGCIQICIRAPYDQSNSKMPEARWIDGQRLLTISNKPVIEVPNFSQHGVFTKSKKVKKENGPADLPAR